MKNMSETLRRQAVKELGINVPIRAVSKRKDGSYRIVTRTDTYIWKPKAKAKAPPKPKPKAKASPKPKPKAKASPAKKAPTHT